MIFILNVDEVVEVVLNNDSPNACPYWNDKHTERLEDSLSTYEFEMPAAHEASEFVKAENFVVREDLDGNLILFTIKNVDEYSRDGQYIKKVYAENAAISELNGDIIRPMYRYGYTASAAMDFVLNGTLWRKGKVDYMTTNTFGFSNYETALYGVQHIAKGFGGELRYRISLIKEDAQDGDATKEVTRIGYRYIDLLERRGEETGKRFEYAKDIIGVRRIEDSTELATAIIPIGKADAKGVRMTIKSVNNNYDYIWDSDARDRWSRTSKHIFGVYINEDAENPQDLLNKATKELNRRKNPRYTYEVDVVMLERKAGISHEDVRLGDTIIVKDMNFEPYLALNARAIEIVRSYTDSTQDKVTLGEYVKLYISTPSIIKTMQNQITAVQGKADAAEVVYKGAEPPVDTDMLWLDMSNPKLFVWKKFDGATWVPATPTSAQEIGAETPEGAQAKANAVKASAISEAVAAAKTDAEEAARAAATAEGALADARAKAYADGVVTKEETARINQAAANLTTAKSFATSEANAAKTAAIAYADDVGVNAQAKAEWYAAVKSGTNLISGIEKLTPATPYTWVTDYTPDGIKGRILKKVHTAGATKNDAGWTFPNYIKINPKKTYLLEVYVKASDANSKYYWGYEEYNGGKADNDAGNGPYIVSGAVATAAGTGKWVKHYALIAPHDSGAEGSSVGEQSTLTPDTDFKFYDVNSAYIRPKVYLTFQTIDASKGSTMYATKFGLYEVGSDDGVFDLIQEEAIAQANLADTRARAYADGVATDAENAAIAEAQKKADAAEAAAKAAAAADAKAKADAAQAAAISSAATTAQAKADAAQAAAINASEKRMQRGSTAPVDTSVIWIKTGVTPELQYRYNGSAWVALAPTTAAHVGAETPSGAQSKADAAKSAAISAAATDAQTKADAAKAAAISAAKAESDLAEARAKAYADGILTEEEKANLAGLEQSLADANSYADSAAAAAKSAAITAAATDAQTKADAAKSAAINSAASDASTKATNAQNAAIAASEKKIVKQSTAPTDLTVLWLKTGTTPEIMYRHNGSAWIPTAPENASQIKYASGTTIEALKPAAAGADVTSANTSKDTAAVNGVAASTIATAAANFNNRNDRKSTTPANPTLNTTGATVDHTVNTDGSVDISFEWTFSGTGDAYDIDGFIVYVYAATANTAYTFGTDKALEQVFTTAYDNRSIVIQGVAANKYYTFGIQAYRRVDKDINANGILRSAIVKSSITGENPYQPSTTVAFAGNITGTVNGTAASTVVTNANAGKTANDKITANVGSGTLESTTGAQSKADAAKNSAVSTAATDATNKSDAARDTAIGAGLISSNSLFTKWTGTYPVGFGAWNKVPTKETTLTRGGSGVRMVSTTTSEQVGMNMNTAAFFPNPTDLQYVTVEVDFMLVSGVMDGACVLLDWYNTGGTSYRATLNLKTYEPNPILGKWYTVTAVLKKPANFTGTFRDYAGYVLGNWSTVGAGIKDIIFDRVAFYEAANELNAEATRILSPTSGIVLDANGLVVTGTDGKQSTSVSKNGVNVKNGAFTIEDNITGLKESLARANNLLRDHSFEMMDPDWTSNTYPNLLGYYPIKDYQYAGTTEIFGVWHRIGSPRLNSVMYSDLAITSPFGFQSVVVDGVNYIEQAVTAREGQEYTFSIHAFAPTQNMTVKNESGTQVGNAASVGNLIVEAEFYTDDMVNVVSRQKTSKTFTLSKKTFGMNPTERFAFTFTAPTPNFTNGNFYVVIRLKSEGADKWIELDGAQLIKGDIPMLYDAENSLWLLRKGGGDKLPNISDYLGRVSVREVMAQTFLGHYESYNATTGVYEVVDLPFIDTLGGSKNGLVMRIGGGARTIIGGGEAPITVANGLIAEGTNIESEHINITSDNSIYFHTGVQEGYDASQLHLSQFDDSGTLIIRKKGTSPNALKLVGSTHTFMEFFPQGGTSPTGQGSRFGYIGYGSANQNILTISNSEAGSNGDVIIRVGGSSDYFTFDGVTNGGIAFGTAKLKFLTAGGLQARNAADTAFANIDASKFTVGSRRKFKRNIKKLSRNARQVLRETQIYEYQLKDDFNIYERDEETNTVNLVGTRSKEEVPVQIGLIYEEAPDELKGSSDTIDLYSMNSYTWKAFQELDDDVEEMRSEMQTEIAELKSENKELRDRLEKLESLVNGLIK